MAKWTSENDNKLLLILLAHYFKPNSAPDWETVAKLMGEGFIAGGVHRQATRKLMKQESFVLAKATLQGGGFESASAPSTPSKKRKVLDEISAEKLKEEND